jgi:hypothetical protein
VQEGRRRARRRLVMAVAVGSVALGVVIPSAGAASASSRGGRFAVIKFSPASQVVTLDLPTRGCPARHPSDCVWKLVVNEPGVPGQPSVDSNPPTGTSGVLTVAYPKNFCGVIQADVMIGPAPWRLQFGHKATIQTASVCDPSQLPFTGSTPASGSRGAVTVAKTTPAQLPFTGIDVRPLAIVGLSLMLFGLSLLTTLEQRRRTLRRFRYATKSNPASSYASRALRWFLGE